MLHDTQTVVASPNAAEAEPGHSILQHAMPDDEAPDCEAEKRKVESFSSAVLSCLVHI
jgi:hypothetical protein